jgi:hypothetical protein
MPSLNSPAKAMGAPAPVVKNKASGYVGSKFVGTPGNSAVAKAAAPGQIKKAAPTIASKLAQNKPQMPMTNPISSLVGGMQGGAIGQPPISQPAVMPRPVMEEQMAANLDKQRQQQMGDMAIMGGNPNMAPAQAQTMQGSMGAPGMAGAGAMQGAGNALGGALGGLNKIAPPGMMGLGNYMKQANPLQGVTAGQALNPFSGKNPLNQALAHPIKTLKKLNPFR